MPIEQKQIKQHQTDSKTKVLLIGSSGKLGASVLEEY